MLLALGEYASDQLPPELRILFAAELQRVANHDPDPGLRSAALWLVRKWQLRAVPEAAPQTPSEGKFQPGLGWYVSPKGFAMVVLQGPMVFTMGSPQTEKGRIPEWENQHRRRIGRSYALAAHEVTVRQYQEFRPEYRPEPTHAPTQDGPAISVSWFEAAEFCNWLSEQEGLPPAEWCYPPDQQFADGMRMYPDYFRRKGYRLPSEAEWEYACRAGSNTSRFCGDAEELLVHYAWFSENAKDTSPLPVGTLKPNDFGLFDMHGNVDEWIQERFRGPYVEDTEGVPTEDVEDAAVVLASDERILRSGSYGGRPAFVRSANRYRARADTRRWYYGFRVARTMADANFGDSDGTVNE
jgi:formylglycine-generating enzyme required for sulfatase activity